MSAAPRRGLAVGTQRQYRWLTGLVWAILALNLLDAVFTLVWVQGGHAREANALVRELVEQRPVHFLLTKIALVSLGSFLLWRLRGRPLAVVAIFAAFLVYYFVLLYHLRFLSTVIRHSMPLA
jgi:hypothetical protein